STLLSVSPDLPYPTLFRSLKDTLVAAWEAIKEFVINAWNAYWSQVKSNFELVTGALSAAWTWIKDRFTAVWNTIKEVVVAAFEQDRKSTRLNSSHGSISYA